jgi:hypothetical protein
MYNRTIHILKRIFMDATILDLRYKMREVLKALNRRERINILYHGKLKGTIIPAGGKEKKKVADHPFFGMKKDEKATVQDELSKLRKNRYAI